MIRLVNSEVKKIVKNKINILLTIGLLAWCMLTTLNNFNRDMPTYQNSDEVVLKTFDGTPLTSMKEVMQYADTILSEYKEEATPTLWKRYCDDYNRLYHTFTKDIDTQLMKELYGEQYEKVIHHQPINLTENEYSSLSQKMASITLKYDNHEYNYDSTTKTGTDFPIYYKKQAELYTLNLIYKNQYTNSLPIEDQTNLDLYMLSNKDENYNHNKVDTHYTNNFVSNEHKVDPAFNQFIKQKIDKETQLFGSTVSLQLLKTSLISTFNFFTLLIIAIILANSFSIENHTKTDQIIVPTAIGYHNITIAKILAGILTAVGIILIQLLFIFIIAFFLLKPGDWNLPLINQLGLCFDLNLTYVTYKEFILTHITMVLVGSIAIASTTMAISCFSKNRFIAVIVNFIFIMLPFFVTTLLPTAVIKLLPCFFTESDRFFEYNLDSGSPLITFFDQTFPWKYISVLVWIAVILLLSIFMVIQAKRHRVANR